MCAPTTPVNGEVDAVQTLVSVNNMDQSVFLEDDKAIAQRAWKSVFVHVNDAVTESIFTAIATKSGSLTKNCDKVGAKTSPCLHGRCYETNLY